jgi:hypothetical protein
MRPHGQARHEAGHGVVLSQQSSQEASSAAHAAVAPSSRTRASASRVDRTRRMAGVHTYPHSWGAASLAPGTFRLVRLSGLQASLAASSPGIRQVSVSMTEVAC